MEKQFLVALHVYNRNQALQEAEKILIPDGAHGVLLVNNGRYISSSRDVRPNMFDLCDEIKQNFPNYQIGLNPLDLVTQAALKRMETKDNIDILWVDNGGVEEDHSHALLSEGLLDGIRSMKASYYGGVAFKYLQQPKDLKQVTKLAAEWFGAVITSGEKTGSEPDVEKIITMQQYIDGKAKLGIASGMSPENVPLFLPYADIFIVATSLNEEVDGKKKFFAYDQDRIKLFREKIET